MNKNAFRAQLQHMLPELTRLRIWFFLGVIAVLYGFIMWRISVLAGAEPDATAIAAQAHTTSKPHIDEALVEKVKQLEDNNVTVHALFDQARKNPFRE